MIYLNSFLINCDCLNVLAGFPYESSVIYNHDCRYILKSYIETRYYKKKDKFYKKILIHCDKCMCDRKVLDLFLSDVYLSTSMILEDGYYHTSERFTISEPILI